MDANIRTLLTVAQKSGAHNGVGALEEAYDTMKTVTETLPAIDAPPAFGHDLFVICSELAFQFGRLDIASDCIKLYFLRTPPTNQFLCRAYLCQAQILAPDSAENPSQLEKAVVSLLKAISMAKENPRYHFLVYNASVLYWHFCRPFLKPNYRQFLAPSLHQVVKALDDIDDKDFEWRAQLMIALIECHMDAGRRNDATHIASAAATFIKTNVPQLYKTVFGLLVKHQLIENSKLSKDIKNSAEFTIYFRICKLKLAIENGDTEKDIPEEMRKILNQTLGQDDGLSRVKSGMSVKSATTLSREDDSKTPTKGSGSATPTGSRSGLLADSPEKPYLLLELGRLAMEQDVLIIAQRCVEALKECQVQDAGFYLEVEFLNCELMVKNLADKQESYQKSAIDVRLAAVHHCDEALMNALRLGNPNVIQAGCVTQWNLCLPMLQPNLRKQVRRSLILIADALQDIQSLLISLRCQIHMELAKCEEDIEQIQVAKENLLKAQALDDGCVYKERLEVALNRLNLRAELYSQPERAEDQAAMIIEQARKADSGTMRMKRSLLVRAGQALAPDTFLLVLDSESDIKEVSPSKGAVTQISRLSGKARQFIKCVGKAAGHLKRLGDENDRERARLWGDLAKTARKQEVWDVCRVAARFCLLYDDDRWKNELPPTTTLDSPGRQRSKSETAEGENKTGSDLEAGQKSSLAKKDSASSRPTTPQRAVPLYDKDLIRMMAEINFIFAESMIHLLRSEGVELGDQPIPPKDKSKHPKGYVAKKPEEDPAWLEYVEWITSLSASAVQAFLRGSTLGVCLDEPWIVCSAAAYLWNYSNHLFSQNRHRETIFQMQSVLDALKKVGHSGETVLLVDICTALAYGLIKPWEPAAVTKDMVVPSPVMGHSESDSTKTKAKGKGNAPGASKSKGVMSVTISPDAMPDLKKAIEVCEYAIGVTNGENLGDVVPIQIRQPLLQTWVKAKQMAQSQVNKNYATEDENNREGQRPMTRAIVGVEMMWLNTNGIMEFKEMPTLNEAIEMVGGCDWTDKLAELQLWTRLTSLAFEARNHQSVLKCSKRALAFEAGTQPKHRKLDMHNYTVEQEMLGFASSLLGQSLILNTQGNNSVRRQAMDAFLNSARFCCNAKNGELVMMAARHYWNACLPLINQPTERELLKQPIKQLLSYITATTVKELKKEDESTERGADEARAVAMATVPAEGDTAGVEAVVKSSSTGIIGGPEDDLTLRAYLYGLLFQAFTDKGEWEEGLRAMDQAVNDMPRTNHRLLIFKHLVMVRAKLGKTVHMSIQKFKDESEDYVAHMWHKVALCSKEQLEQLQAYQNSVEALTINMKKYGFPEIVPFGALLSMKSESSSWQKFDYLLEFGQWLFCNEFPIQDALDQLQWAVDILLNMKFEVEKKEGKSKKKGQQKRQKSSQSTGKAGKSKSPAPSAGGTMQGSRKTPEQGKASSTSEGRTDAASENEHELNAGDYIPVHKQAVIGLAAANVSLTVSDLHDVKQLEGLFRAHTLLAVISGRSSPQHKDHCISAYTFIMRIWQVSLAASGPVMKELAKNPPPEPTPVKGSAKKGKKDKEKEPVKEKPKRKGPLDVMPGSIEEWATYDVPDEVLEAFKQDMIKGAGVNSNTIDKPTLTLYYLDILIKQLRDLGYSHLTLPILAFCDMLARGLCQHRALTALVHLRALGVCVELNLTNGVKFHEKLADVKLNEEEQAKCQESMALRKELLAQVAREEKHLQESLAKMKPETDVKQKSLPAPLSREQLAQHDKAVSNNVTSQHLGLTLGALQIYRIWTDTAEVLLQQGVYQTARDLLSEAHQAALTFEDKALEARILYLLGRLAYLEAQCGQAVNFCLEAQRIHSGDEVAWYDSTMVMVDATLADLSQKNRFRKARGILINALNVFRDVLDTRPNKLSVIGFILAQLEANLGVVQMKLAETEHKDICKPKVTSALLSACKKLQNAYEKLTELGYLSEALPHMKLHAAILTKLAKHHPLTADKHNFYVQAASVLREATEVAEFVMTDVQTLASIQQLRNISLPAQREYADVCLLLADLMLDISEQEEREKRNNQMIEERKSSVLKIVEELIRETPHYEGVEAEWADYNQVANECALSYLTNIHGFVRTIPHLKARALYSMGRALRLMSLNNDPDPPKLWDVHEMFGLNISSQVQRQHPEGADPGPVEADTEARNAAEDEAEEAVDTSSKQFIKYSQLIKAMKDHFGVSHEYLLQAVEVLCQALCHCMQHHLTEITGAVALQLAECCGQFDPAMTSHFLALHQSCETSGYLLRLMTQALSDPSQSQISALLHQREYLLRSDVSTNLSCSPYMSHVLSSLQQTSQAWQRLSITENHLDLMKEFPANFTLLILQHSPDKSHLYGAVMDKAKSGAKANQKHTSLHGLSKARVVRVNTSAAEIEGLVSEFRTHKQNVMQLLLKQEYQRTQQAQRKRMLQNLTDSFKSSSQTSIDVEMETEEKQLQDQFTTLLNKLEAYLQPITTQLQSVLRPASATTISNSNLNKSDGSAGQEAVILLADPCLLELPLEALHVLQSESISALSRDVSMQMLYHRIHQEPVDEAVLAERKAKEKLKPPPRIPGLRDASKKQAKIIPLDRPVPNGSLAVDTHAFRYFVDPHCDCAETETNSPVEKFNALLELHSQQFTPRWLGITGHDHTPSTGEYEVYLTECSGFIFYGMEHFLAYLPPHKVAALNIQECQLAMIFDLAQTNKSFSRQSKIDVLKRPDSLALERPVESALLLSLTGVNCILMNQWHTMLRDNAEKLDTMLKDLLSKGLSTGQAVRMMFTPYRRPQDEEEKSDQVDEKNTTSSKDSAAAALTDAKEQKEEVEVGQPASKEPESAEEQTLNRNWFNMACYGLPNLIITQIGKP